MFEARTLSLRCSQPACRALNPYHARYCRRCGYVVDRHDQTWAEAESTCRHCGQAVPAQAAYCHRCRNELDFPPTDGTPRATSPSPLVVVVVMLFLVMLLVATVAAMLKVA